MVIKGSAMGGKPVSAVECEAGQCAVQCVVSVSQFSQFSQPESPHCILTAVRDESVQNHKHWGCSVLLKSQSFVGNGALQLG
jgi:hypothetical protein